MHRHRFKSLRLVTAHYHMPRSKLLFEHAMPAMDIVFHPVFPAMVRSENWWRWPGTTKLLAQEYIKYVAAFFITTILPPGNV